MQYAIPQRSTPMLGRQADPGIDWEPTPSLAHLIARTRPQAVSDEPSWAETMPADFDVLSPSDRFSEPLPGMVLREMTEPEVFRLFFDR